MMAFDFPELLRLGIGTFLSFHGLPIKMSHACLFLEFPSVYLPNIALSQSQAPSHILYCKCLTYFFKDQTLTLRDHAVSTQNKEEMHFLYQSHN